MYLVRTGWAKKIWNPNLNRLGKHPFDSGRDVLCQQKPSPFDHKIIPVWLDNIRTGLNNGLLPERTP